jgi:hypothetical protein
MMEHMVLRKQKRDKKEPKSQYPLPNSPPMTSLPVTRPHLLKAPLSPRSSMG